MINKINHHCHTFTSDYFWDLTIKITGCFFKRRSNKLVDCIGLTVWAWVLDCECFRKILTPPFLVMGGSVTMKLLGKTHFWVKGVVMWAWPGLYAPQLPQIRLLAVAISFFNKFLKFFRVVNGHAKTDFWLQQLYWLRPFSDPSGLKNPIFLPFFDEPVLILLAVDCQFYAKFRTGRSKTLRRANKKSA